MQNWVEQSYKSDLKCLWIYQSQINCTMAVWVLFITNASNNVIYRIRTPVLLIQALAFAYSKYVMLSLLQYVGSMKAILHLFPPTGSTCTSLMHFCYTTKHCHDRSFHSLNDQDGYIDQPIAHLNIQVYKVELCSLLEIFGRKKKGLKYDSTNLSLLHSRINLTMTFTFYTCERNYENDQLYIKPGIILIIHIYSATLWKRRYH